MSMEEHPDRSTLLPVAIPPQPESTWYSTAALVCGLIACILNSLLFLAPIGVIFSVLAIIFGLIGYARRRHGLSGFFLGLASLLLIAIWLFSFAVMYIFDPTITFHILP